MTPDIVVDVGNSCMKWGLCRQGRVADRASLPVDDQAAWQAQLTSWGIMSPCQWAISGVNPARRNAFADWLSARGTTPLRIENHGQLPIDVAVEAPDRVGIDRLLNALAVKHRQVPAIVVDAGSAVTVDLIDGKGCFQGGAIFPGLQLMARALHEHTALLPLVKVDSPNPILPGRSTTAAIEAGIWWAVAGGIQALMQRLSNAGNPQVFLTGGDAPSLLPALGGVIHWPEMTLEGVRIAAEAQP